MFFPGMNFEVITPSDATDFTRSVKAMLGIYCGAAGNVAIVRHDDSVEVITVGAGSWLPIAAKRVNNTSTTVAAASLLGVWK